VPELASRLSGSSDIYAPTGRRTYASINFVTCHDGFTLTDLVSYEKQTQRGQREENRDGFGRQLQLGTGEWRAEPTRCTSSAPGTA